MSDWFAEALAKYARIAIAGGPRVGKTTLTGRVTDRPVIHTDDTMSEPWEQQPFIAIERCRPHASFVIEGVQVPRALRKGLVVDAVLWLDQALAPVTPRQASMGKGVLSVFAGWRAANPNVPHIFVPPGRIRNIAGAK